MKISAIHRILFLAVFLTGCGNGKDCVCPEYYSPVCGSNGKTYENPCQADCDNVQYIDGECPVYGIGIIVFLGDTATGGCGFLVNILDQKYKPLYLSAEFQEDELVVSLRYRRLNEYFTCSQPYGHYQVIDILEISKILY